MAAATAPACGWPICILSTFRPSEEDKIKNSDILEKKAKNNPAVPPSRFERKFAVIPANAGLALSLLRHVCLRDKEYPDDFVNSLYFDTADLDQYQKSSAGEYRKDKVRIRWYGDEINKGGNTEVYLERKTRQGFASSKQRKKFTVPSTFLEASNLNKGILDRITIIQTLAGFGYFPDKPLIPVIRISYLRHRFSDILTGTRVSYDEDIRAAVIAPDLIRKEVEMRLQNSVIEVKGPSFELPLMLRQLRIMDLDWSRFSKYGSCLDLYFAEPGSLGRNWPSGRFNLP